MSGSYSNNGYGCIIGGPYPPQVILYNGNPVRVIHVNGGMYPPPQPVFPNPTIIHYKGCHTKTCFTAIPIKIGQINYPFLRGIVISDPYYQKYHKV